MAIIKARKEAKKPPRAAANNANAGGSSSLAMAEMPPHWPGAGADYIQPPPAPLPPGVYFSPSKEECLEFLNRSIASDSVLPDVRGYIFHANVYGESPDMLRRQHPPASSREGDHAWWFLSETKFQSQTSNTKRSDRHVGTAGYWRLDQNKTTLADDAGFKNRFGFYTGTSKANYSRDKTTWLMQEFTSTMDDGAGKKGMPALYRVYVTPNANNDQLMATYGEKGIKKWPDGTKKPARVVVQEEYFDVIANLLRVPDVDQEHAALPQAPPPPPPLPVAPEALLDYYYGQQGQYLGQYQQQQQGQYHGQHYYHQMQHEQWAAPPAEVDILGQYQQQEPFFGSAPPLPPPASLGLLSEVAADTPLDNLSMSMPDLMGMLNEQPSAMATEEPAELGKEHPVETVKEEEPYWDSLDNIVGDDDFARLQSTSFPCCWH